MTYTMYKQWDKIEFTNFYDLLILLFRNNLYRCILHQMFEDSSREISNSISKSYNYLTQIIKSKRVRQNNGPFMERYSMAARAREGYSWW